MLFKTKNKLFPLTLDDALSYTRKQLQILSMPHPAEEKIQVLFPRLTHSLLFCSRGRHFDVLDI